MCVRYTKPVLWKGVSVCKEWDFCELFAGCGSLTQALAEDRYAGVKMDIDLSYAFDFLSDAGFVLLDIWPNAGSVIECAS